MSGIILNGFYINVPYPYKWLDLSNNSNKIKDSYFQGYYSPYYSGTGSILQGRFVVDQITGRKELIYVSPYYLPGFIDVSGNVIVRNKNLYVQNGNMLINGNLYVSGKIYKNQNFSNNNTFLGNLAMQNYQSKIFSLSDLGRYL
jgi:hypothetical protein